MSNEYFNPASVPAPNAPGSSAVIRGEFASLAAAFDKLPAMAGSADEFVVVNSAGTALVASGFSAASVATLSGAETLANKTLNWDDNTWVGFGSAATKEAGTGADEVLLLSEANKLPALDGSNLTNLNPANLTNAAAVLGINLKADANNAVLTGAPVATTAASGNNSTRIATTAFVMGEIVAAGGVVPSNTTPAMDGVAAPGSSAQYSRGDHVHPTDTSRAPASAATATGTSLTPVIGLSAADVQAAVEELAAAVAGGVVASDIDFTPAGTISATNVQGAIQELDGDVAALSSSTSSALNLKAPLASPAFTGNPTAPTPLSSDNDTSIATTAFVQTLLAQQPVGIYPSNTAPAMDGVASAGVGVEGSRFDHVHPTDTSRAPASAATAAGTSFAPTGNIAATTVQAALVELDNEKQANLPSQSGQAGKVLGTTGATLQWQALGTAAAQNVGVAAGNVVQLDGLARLPAVDGSLLTGIDTEIPDNSITPAKLTQKITSPTHVNLAGTAVDFTGIPSWVKKITLTLYNASTNGASIPLIRLGDSGGFYTTAYAGNASLVSSSVASAGNGGGFALSPSAVSAAVTMSGVITIAKLSESNVWCVHGGLARHDAAAVHIVSGAMVLANALDRLRITTLNGTDMFDSGSANIIYEG